MPATSSRRFRLDGGQAGDHPCRSEFGGFRRRRAARARDVGPRHPRPCTSAGDRRHRSHAHRRRWSGGAGPRRTGRPWGLPLGTDIATFELAAAVLGGIPPGPLVAVLAGWRDDGGTVEVRHIGLTYGPLALAGDGTAALDADLQPIGAFTTRLEGFFETVDVCARRASSASQDAVTAKMVLGVLSKRNGCRPGQPSPSRSPSRIAGSTSDRCRWPSSRRCGGRAASHNDRPIGAAAGTCYNGRHGPCSIHPLAAGGGRNSAGAAARHLRNQAAHRRPALRRGSAPDRGADHARPAFRPHRHLHGRPLGAWRLRLVINRPLGAGPLDKLIKGFGIDPGQATGDVVMHITAGRSIPVAFFVLHSSDWKGPPPPGDFGSAGHDRRHRGVQGHRPGSGPKRRLIMVGYAGWGPGQQEQEMARKDWLTAPADPDLVFDDDIATKWERASRRGRHHAVGGVRFA